MLADCRSPIPCPLISIGQPFHFPFVHTISANWQSVSFFKKRGNVTGEPLCMVLQTTQNRDVSGAHHVRACTTLNQDREGESIRGSLPVDDLFGGVTGTHWYDDCQKRSLTHTTWIGGWYRKCQYHADKQHTRDDPTRQVSKKRIWQHTKRGHMYIQFSKFISSSFPLLNLFWIENTNVVHLVWRTKRYDQHSRSHRAAIEIMGQHPGSQPETWIKWLL